MIDIQEPKAYVYSEEEKKQLSFKFLLLIHTLLLVYLSLHNFLIPFISNVLTDRNLLSDVHFWFLAHIPAQIWLRRGKIIPEGYLWLLILGSATRIAITVATLPTLKSWSFMSVMLSEMASFIFYFIYYPHRAKGAVRFVAAGGILLPLLLWKFEPDLATKGAMFSTPITKRQAATKLGCQGSEFKMTVPYAQLPAVVAEVPIISCGFQSQAITASNDLKVRNELASPLNVRLYELKVSQGRMKWKFKRLFRIESGASQELEKFIKDGYLYLLKSPEKRSLGHLIVFPQSIVSLPLAPGSAVFNYDSIKWVPNE